MESFNKTKNTTGQPIEGFSAGMEKEFNTIIQEIKEIKMTAGEKSTVTNTLVAFMDANPIQARAPKTQPTTFIRPTPSPFFSRFSFSPALRMAAVVLVIAIAGGSGLSYAAAGALPGDLFYGAKINFNEAITSALKLTPEAKATYAQTRVETRLAEAETLIDEGKFQGARKAEIEAQIDAHLELALARIESLPADKKILLAQAADEVLLPHIARHRAVVRAMTTSAPVGTSTVPTVTEPVKTATVPVAIPSDPALNTGVSATPVAAIVPVSTDATSESDAQFLSTAGEDITISQNGLVELGALNPERDDIKAKLAVRVKAIQLTIQDAREAFTSGHYRDAITLARKATQMIQTTKEAIAKLVADAEVQAGTPVPPSPAPTGDESTR